MSGLSWRSQTSRPHSGTVSQVPRTLREDCFCQHIDVDINNHLWGLNWVNKFLSKDYIEPLEEPLELVECDDQENEANIDEEGLTHPRVLPPHALRLVHMMSVIRTSSGLWDNARKKDISGPTTWHGSPTDWWKGRQQRRDSLQPSYGPWCPSLLEVYQRCFVFLKMIPSTQRPNGLYESDCSFLITWAGIKIYLSTVS